MKALRALFRDEAGTVLSAEMVMVGTLGVVGAGVGLAAVSKSVNDELSEMALAFRCLDQSYCVAGHEGCRAWTAGSCFQQRPVEESLADLQGYIDRGTATDDRGEEATIKQRSDRTRDEQPSDGKQRDGTQSRQKKSDRNRDDADEVLVLPDDA